MSQCKHCDAGFKLVGSDHYLVRSIIPAKVKIVACKNKEMECRDCSFRNCQCEAK